MKKSLKLVVLALALFCVCYSCKKSEKHFLTDENYRNNVHQQFLKRKETASSRNTALFSVFDKNLSVEQREAMEFLYAYMPISDLAEYDGDFFLKHVDASFAARDYFDWGKTIPEDVFRHFVLVYRINNENLDTARLVFFDELKDRVKGMSMYDAALEVNHWCHEKVTYKGTDGRTSAPLALMRTSWGRCGEESTFTTTALRAVGIPARQCYTPRWAHTDDNHAWVEVWIDGKWHFLGACEPEPELDVAWFTGPAKRAMMVHTNVFGIYNGPEEKNLEESLYSKINLLGNYADTRNVNIKVVDANDKPVEGASLKFKVYNYAELYSVAESVTKADGTASIKSGIGDLLVWANKGEVFGYGKSSPDSDVVTIKLDKAKGYQHDEVYTLAPPVQKPVKEIDASKIAANAKRLAHEDSIRNAYMSTFVTKERAYKLADELKLNKDEVWNYLQFAQGNYAEIEKFIRTNKDNKQLFRFLGALYPKDIRDTPADYLTDHLNANASIKTGTPENLIVSDVLSPRISLELIKPWRGKFAKIATPEETAAVQGDINYLVSYFKQNIKISNENYYNCPITPVGVYDLKIADKKSRDIAFVAACRSMGIASRLERATAKPQYYENGKWNDVFFETEAKTLAKGTLVLNNDAKNAVKPAYGTHYTLAYFENGDFTTLDFESTMDVESMSSLNEYPCKLALDAGYYRLMVGNRANDGSVTIHSKYFEIKENQTLTNVLKLPETEGKIAVKGILDMNTVVTLNNEEKKSLKELSAGKGLVICFSDPGKEPTKHILQDIPAQKTALDEWGGSIVFMVPDDKLNKAFDASVFKNLPKHTLWGTDNGRVLLNSAVKSINMNFSNNFPLTLYVSDNGGILFVSEGYRIGIGEDWIKIIKLEASTKK